LTLKINYYLPKNIENLKTLKSDNPEWDEERIYSKTGIDNRYISNDNQTALDLAMEASKNFDTSNIDLLIFISQSPDYFLPSTSCILQDKLNLNTNIMSFDINMGCSGFIYGLSVASSLLKSGVANKALIVCSDTYSKFISKNDRTCRPIFSDGAALTILDKSDCDFVGPFVFGTDGSGYKDLIVETGGARKKENKANFNKIFMDGNKVFMFTINTVPKLVNELLKKSKLQIDQIDLFIFHQASKFVIDNLIKKLSLDEDKVFNNYHKIGNTVSASIPIAIKDAVNKDQLKKGNNVMLIGFGVGLSWGGSILKW